MQSDVDQAAVERLRRGEAAAFRELFERHHAVVLRCLTRTSNLPRAELEELVQEVFVRFHQSVRSSRGSLNVRAWLLTVARNALVSHARKRGTEAGALQQARWVLPAQGDVDAEHESQLRELEVVLRAEPDEETKRIAAAYYAEAGVTTQALADRFGMPKGTLTVKLVRFRQKLHRALLLRRAQEDAR